MPLVSQSQTLCVVTLLLCLLPSCSPSDQPIESKNSSNSDVTPQAQSEVYQKILNPSLPESCSKKLRHILNNVTAYCEAEAAALTNKANVSCHEISSNLLKLLQAEQEKSRECIEQVNVARSLLHTFKQQMADTKDKLQAMSGIAIRFQGNRTALNDLLNTSHQRILNTVSSVVLDIDNVWRSPVNYSEEESKSHRNLDQELQICKNEAAEAQKAFRHKVQQLALCVDEKRELEEELRSNKSNCEDSMRLQFNLNKTLDELKTCIQTKVALEHDRSLKELDLKILIKENKNLEERGSQLLENYKYILDVKDKLEVDLASVKEALEISNKRLASETSAKVRCNEENAKLQVLFADKVTYLQLLLRNLISLKIQVNTIKALLDEILTSRGQLNGKIKNLNPIVEELMTTLLSKHRQLGNCAMQNTKLHANVKDMQETIMECKKEAEELKDRNLAGEEKLKSLEQELARLGEIDKNLVSCNSENKRLRKEFDEVELCLNKTRLTNSELKANITDLSNANTELQQQNAVMNKVSETCNKTIATTTELLKTAENKLVEMQQKIDKLEAELISKEEVIKASQNEKDALATQLKNVKGELNACISERVKEKHELLEQAKSKNELLETCNKKLQETEESLQNYTIWCETSQSSSEKAHQNLHQKLTEELNNATEENKSLKASIVSMQMEIEKCSREKIIFRTNLQNETAELKDCNAERHSLSEKIVYKDRYIDDLMQDLANLNLTTKLNEIRLNSRLSEVEIDLQRLEYMLKHNRNGIRTLEEYGTILIMQLNKNYDMLRLLKEAVVEDSAGNQMKMDSRLEPLLRRLLRTIEDHHSRIYIQLLQMKSRTDKDCTQMVPIYVKREVQRGRTPGTALLNAAREGNETEAHILLLLGANVSVQDREGMTPLHWAALQGHSGMCELLLTRGAHPDIHAQGRSSKTPLHLAAEQGQVDALKVLLDFGARTEARALDRATPLLYAAKQGQEEAVRVLLERGADTKVANIQRQTAKDLAASFPSIVSMIAEYEKKGQT